MELTYQEKLNLKRNEKIKEMLRLLPVACSDYVHSITLTTTVLTRMAYVIDLRTFCEFALKEIPYYSEKKITEWNDEDWNHFTRKDLTTYIDYLSLYYKDGEFHETQIVLQNHENGIMRKLSSLRSFFAYMYESERLSGNIAQLISLPKLHEKPILYLSDSEVDELLSTAIDGAGFSKGQMKYHAITYKRDNAILMMFLGTGVRLSECVGINIEDLDFENNAVLVTRKGGNQVILYYPDEVKTALQNYLEQRSKIEALEGHEHALFLSLQKRRITQRSVELMVKKICRIVSPLKKRMSPHKLRSTYATRLYKETEDIYLVADALGHSDVNTTRKHYAAMSEERRKEAAKNVHLGDKESID